MNVVNRLRAFMKQFAIIQWLYSYYRPIERGIKKILFRIGGGTKYSQQFYAEGLLNLSGGGKNLPHITEHLGSIFYHALSTHPKLIVELGTRSGQSTKVLSVVASISDATLLSIDIEDCSKINVPYGDHWHFIQSDDVKFGKEQFTHWCLSHGYEPKADVIFIDTSHLFEHTKAEIEVWSKYLSNKGVMIFHDTNMGTGMYYRFDGTIEFGWNNKRGVIKAIEEFLDTNYNEKNFFVDVKNSFLIRHYPNCNGLTVLQRIESR